MRIKRTGWQAFDRDVFVEVIPQDDLQEHILGDECWCNPRTEYNENSRPLIVHSSADGREFKEKI